MKKLGKWVCLANGKVGHIVGETIDGLTVVVDGRIVHALPKDVTVIPPPVAPEPPQPQRTVQNFQTSHEPPARVEIPPGGSVMRDGKWE
jgi:hypothetical protein